MTKKTFKQTFNAVFHDEEAFEDFCTLDLDKEVGEIKIQARNIYRTSEKLKKYLRFIDKVILKKLSTNTDIVHSYIKERSALTAVQSHASSKAFFLTDIKDFFGNIKTQNVHDIFDRDKRLIPISDFEEYINLVVKMTTWRGAIPIGFPTSPQISNAFLLDFDKALQQFCDNNGYVVTRYSDDIIISSQSTCGFDALENTIQEMLREYASENFVLNSEKTRVTHIGNKVKILGLVITLDGRVTIDSKYKKNIESLLYFYGSDKERYNHFLEKVFDGKEKSLFGMLHYAKSIDPDYLEKLQRKYGAYTLSALMEDRWSDQR